ncbi:MAG: DUF58 domain-containing protein [Bacteroidetes bacterium]|nr:DUF58 domain-containing protein [Bacteroidota bacterium]MDE2673117.1 DUF58 domain-containing protein [Bacteroidota bacterium]MXZ04048.1 DUF58 domain-containing protein [Rhodothermaceae bacterium]MYF40643.1 DUF58 domain-containing protein [Rhodothermaceae bacterium]
MVNRGSTSPLKYLDPVTVSRLKNMEMRARLVVEGFITGLHKSPYHGFSVEFAEHRPYNPGDDLRHVDWKVYAKSDRYYIKQYEEETNLRHYVVLDTSASMQYRYAGQVSKLEYGAYLAAALHFLMVMQRDATGLMTFDSEIRTVLRPRSTMRYLREILLHLERFSKFTSTEPFTGTARALHRVAEIVNRRSLIVIISDLIEGTESQEQVVRALRRLRHKGHEVLIFRILEGTTERLFNLPDRPMVLRDMESGNELSLHPGQLREAYMKRMESLTEYLRRQCLEHAIDYVELDTAVPYDKALLAYLNKRRTLH